MLDVSALSGVRVTRQGAWVDGGLTVAAGCVRGPSDRWIPGADSLVLERATFLAAKAFGELGRSEREGAKLVGLAPAAPTRAGDVILQPLKGEARLAGDPAEAEGAPDRVRGGHWLFFAGEESDVVVCTVLCAEPAADRRCDHVASSVTVDGHIVPEPSPGPFARGAVWVFEHPSLALAGASVLAIAAVTVILWRRPRPRA